MGSAGSRATLRWVLDHDPCCQLPVNNDDIIISPSLILSIAFSLCQLPPPLLPVHYYEVALVTDLSLQHHIISTSSQHQNI